MMYTALDPRGTGFTIIAGETVLSKASAAGDIDNDGYDDFIVGSPYTQSYRGEAWVIYGGEKFSFSDIDVENPGLDPLTTGFKITGEAGYGYFGESVGPAGDINNDGYDDLVIAATNKQVVYVIYGGPKSSRSNLDLGLTPLNPASTGFTITSNPYQFGSLTKTAGDINKDGYADIIIGSGSGSKIVYVIYGGPKSSRSNLDLGLTPLNSATTGFIVELDSSSFGCSVSTAGDINKDGYSDIIIGDYTTGSYRGSAYVIYGGPKSLMSNIDLDTTPLDPLSTGFKITGEATSSFGYSVSTAGDFNQDGFSDIIVGAYQSSKNGAAYVIYGGPKSSMQNIDLSSFTLNPASTGFKVTGSTTGDWFGFSVSTAGDINKDGFSDIIIGAPQFEARGSVYVIYGRGKTSMSNIDLSSDTLNPATTGLMIAAKNYYDRFGFSVASAGDINNDGYSDILMTTWSVGGKGVYIIHSTCTSCLICPFSCKQCSDSDTCTECISPSLLYQSQCFTPCPDSTFPSNKKCKDCPFRCSTCTSEVSCQTCDQGYVLSNSLCYEPSSVPSPSSSSSLSFSSSRTFSGKTRGKAFQTVASGARGIGSLICVGSATFPLTAMVSKIVQSTRYLNVSVSNDLALIYQTWETDLISWQVPVTISSSDHFKPLPSLFAQFGLDSPFLANFWATLLTTSISFGVFVTCLVIRKLLERAKYEGWGYSLIQRFIAGSFNFALVQTYACLDDILFYLVLDAKTNPFNSFYSWTSLILGVVFMALGCLLVLFNLWTVIQYQKVKNQVLAKKKDMTALDAFNQRNKYWELFYSDYNDDNFLSQSFFAIILIRGAMSSFTITVVYEYPLMQTAYLIILDGAIILFLFFKQPFTTLQGKLAQYYFEIITTLVHICTFILGFQDTLKKPSDTVRLIFSTSIIYLNTALISGSLGFMFIEIYETIRYKTLARKPKNSESIAIQATSQDISDAQNETLTNSPVLHFETETRRRQESWILNEQGASSFENFHLLPGLGPKNNNTTILNMEFSRTLDSNFNADHSFIPDTTERNRLEQNSGSMSVRHRHRLLQASQRNRSRIAVHPVNFE